MSETTSAENTQTAESLEYRTEVKQLLDILAHSLYTDREIFLRELISNASDALNRIQFEMLTNQDVVDADTELAIRIVIDEDEKLITIADTGIGMNREELVQNLGTIAHSGAKTFLQNAGTNGDQKATIEEIIGQFGVGFYSAFMVAAEMTVTSRSYRPDDEAWSWKSQGDSRYTLEPAGKAERGTTITIKLKEDAAEFASTWRLESIIRKHSDYVSFPIFVSKVEKEEPETEGDSAEAETSPSDEVIEAKAETAINRQTALWRQTASEVKADEYTDFYKQLTFDFEEPLMHIHLVTDAPANIRSILFIPSKRERGMMKIQNGNEGLKLYSRKVLIQEKNKDLLPEYYRFVEGVVDSEDLPLNVSRETVQSNPLLRQIQKALAGRLNRDLKRMADKKPAQYAKFWAEFGPFLKEGIASDPSSHDALLDMLRFHSTKSMEQDKASTTGDTTDESSTDDSGLTSLKEYVDRMGVDQEDIYYVLGDDIKSVVRSPHLDYFRANDIEVLYLTDPIDGFMTSSLREYEGKSLKNIDDGGLELPDSKEDEKKDEEAVPQSDFDSLVERVKEGTGRSGE